MDDGRYLQAWDLLRATSLDRGTHPAFHNSFRILNLYTEIFCDQAALEVTGSLDAVISMLVKLTLGASSVQPKDFLNQANEILSTDVPDASSEGYTHPETYIRARALQLLHQKAKTLHEDLARWIEGPMDMDRLDLLRQKLLSRATRSLIGCLLKLPAMRTELMLSHARLFFERFSAEECEKADLTEVQKILSDHPNSDSLQNYYCFILLDFSTADRELEELPLANALVIAESLGVKERFVAMARKEMKLRKKQMDDCDRSKFDILKASESETAGTNIKAESNS